MSLIGGPQVNKCEQASSVSQQMSVAGQLGLGKRVPRSDFWGMGGPRSYVQEGCRANRSLYSEVKGITGNDHMRTTPSCGQKEWQTHITENITFPQLHWRAVKIKLLPQFNFLNSIDFTPRCPSKRAKRNRNRISLYFVSPKKSIVHFPDIVLLWKTDEVLALTLFTLAVLTPFGILFVTAWTVQSALEIWAPIASTTKKLRIY